MEITIAVIVIAILVALTGVFKKPLVPARIEVLCQNTGRTFRLNLNKAQQSFTCRGCGRESWVTTLGEGKGNITVTYFDATGTARKLEAIREAREGGLASVDATSGTFVILRQEEE